MDLFVFNCYGDPLNTLYILQASTVSGVCRDLVKCELCVVQGGVESESCWGCWIYLLSKKLPDAACCAVLAETQTMGKLVTVRDSRSTGNGIYSLAMTQCFCPQGQWQNKFSLVFRYHQDAKIALLTLLWAQSTNCQAQQ